MLMLYRKKVRKVATFEYEDNHIVDRHRSILLFRWVFDRGR